MGRKLKLTPELIKEASDLVKMGNYTETVCKYLGIGDTTWYRWMKEGQEEKSGIKRDFWEAIKRAESYAEIRNVQIIQSTAEKAKDDPKLWVAAMTFLERKFPDRWGRKDKVKADLQHTGKDGGPIKTEHETNINLAELTDEELALLERIAEKGSKPSGD